MIWSCVRANAWLIEQLKFKLWLNLSHRRVGGTSLNSETAKISYINTAYFAPSQLALKKTVLSFGDTAEAHRLLGSPTARAA